MSVWLETIGNTKPLLILSANVTQSSNKHWTPPKKINSGYFGYNSTYYSVLLMDPKYIFYLIPLTTHNFVKTGNQLRHVLPFLVCITYVLLIRLDCYVMGELLCQ